MPQKWKLRRMSAAPNSTVLLSIPKPVMDWWRAHGYSDTEIEMSEGPNDSIVLRPLLLEKSA